MLRVKQSHTIDGRKKDCKLISLIFDTSSSKHCSFLVQLKDNSGSQYTIMFVKLTYGENLEHFFNINVTNNILLDYVKTYTKEQMLEQINGKKSEADMALHELERDLERKKKIEGEVENEEDESEEIKELKDCIKQWKVFLEDEVEPYLRILNSKQLIVDFEGDSALNLSDKPKQYAKESGILSKQAVQLVYKVEKEADWKKLTYSIKSPDDRKKENETMNQATEDGA